MTDDDLIRDACHGNVAAYESLVIRHQDVAFRTAFVITGDAGAAEDAAQEAFLRAYRSLRRFRAGSPFRPWLLKIVSNEARRRAAANARQRNLLRTLPEIPGAVSPPSPEARVVAKEVSRTLIDAIGKLSETDRLVIIYRFALGLNGQEMAQAMSCPPGTVKSRLSRAVDRLRSILMEEDHELLGLAAES